MKDNNVYEMTLDSTQLNILERALNAFISEAYSGIEYEVVDVENTYEEIKVAFDIQQVIRYEKCGDGSPKQTSKGTSLVWIKKAFDLNNRVTEYVPPPPLVSKWSNIPEPPAPPPNRKSWMF